MLVLTNIIIPSTKAQKASTMICKKNNTNIKHLQTSANVTEFAQLPDCSTSGLREGFRRQILEIFISMIYLLKVDIFHSYVKLPDGTYVISDIPSVSTPKHGIWDPNMFSHTQVTIPRNAWRGKRQAAMFFYLDRWPLRLGKVFEHSGLNTSKLNAQMQIM